MANYAQSDHAGLKAAVAAEIKTQLTPIQEILAKLSEPASRAGTTPERLLAEYTDGGRTPWGLRPDGSLMARPGNRAKGAGLGEMWQGLFLEHGGNPDRLLLPPERVQKIRKKLYDPTDPDDHGTAPERMKGGYGVLRPGQTKAALAETQGGAGGGYTVPPQFSNNLMRFEIENTFVEQRASLVTMDGLTWQAPYLDQETSAGSGKTNFTGGVQATWTSEMATRAESEPRFKQCELRAWELSFYTVVSNNLLADNAVGLDALLTMLFGEAMAWYKEYAYLQGDAVGKPSGVINDPATIAITRGTTGRVRYVDLVTMYSRIIGQSLKNAVWVAHQSIMPDLLQMHDSSGNQTAFGAGRLIYQSIDKGAQQSPVWAPLGLPMFFTEKVPALGSKGDIGLYDFSKYLIGKRLEIEVAMSTHVNFLTNASAYRVLIRGDGRPWVSGPITLADGVYTVSPFCTLSA